MSEAAEQTIRVTLRDVFERRAFVRFSPDAKAKLAEMAGAPWNDNNPNAKISPLQREVLARKEREKIIHGGSGLGKTTTIAMEAIVNVMTPFSECAIGGSRYDHVSSEFRMIAKGLRKLFARRMNAFSRFAVKTQSNYHEYDIRAGWGSTIVGLSTDSDEGAAFLGRQFHWIGLSEGSHMAPTILDTRVLRALDRAMVERSDGVEIETGYLSIYTTPRGYEGCSASEWERVMRATAQKPEMLHYGKVPFARTVWLREAAATENPSYSRSAFEARRESLDKHAFDETYLGKMSFKSGMIFKELETDRVVRPMPKPEVIRRMTLGVGIDTGHYFASVLYGMYEVSPGLRHRWRLGTVYTAGATIQDNMAETRDMVCRILAPVYGMPERWEDSFESLKERIDIWGIDPASQHKPEVMDWLDMGISQWELSLLDSIDRLRLWLKRGESFFVEGETDVLIDQMRKYIWKSRKGPVSRIEGIHKAPVIQEPKKEYDHLIDADRGISHLVEDMGPLAEQPSPVSAKEWWKAQQKEAVFGPMRDALARAERRGGMWT